MSLNINYIYYKLCCNHNFVILLELKFDELNLIKEFSIGRTINFLILLMELYA